MNVNSIQPAAVQKQDNIKKAVGVAAGIAAVAGTTVYLAKTGKLDTFVSAAKEKLANVNSDSIKRKFGTIQKAVKGTAERIKTGQAAAAVKEKAHSASEFLQNKFLIGKNFVKDTAKSVSGAVSNLISKAVKH